MSILSVAALIAGSWVNFHTPHDSVFSLAAAPVGSGPPVLVAVWNDQRIRVSEDDGVTWKVLPNTSLNAQEAFELVYHPGMPAAGGAGLMIVATNDGPWSVDPVTLDSAPLDSGIQSGDRFGIDLAAPLSGNGPALMLTRSGSAYTLSTSTATWTRVFDGVEVFKDRGDVALSPHYDAGSAVVGAHDMFVALNGRVFRSEDGGLTWGFTHFQTQATSGSDWLISSIALSEDYENDHTMVVGRVRKANGPVPDEGELWTSATRGSTAVLAQSLDTGVTALIGTPPGPGGQRSFLAAGRAYPGVGAFQGIGILRSDDGGLTWSDNGNFQDFQLEDHPGHATGAVNMAFETQLAVPPDYGSSGRAYYVRMEGLFRSSDEGERWQLMPTVTPDRVRDVKTAKGPNDEVLVFSANYGSGMLMIDPAAGTTTPLRERTPLVYLSRAAVSPNYALDGRILAAGSVGIVGWQAPTHGNFPTSGPGWIEPRLRDQVTGMSLEGYPWEPVFSGTYNGLGGPGTDSTYLWVTREGTVRRTDNDGRNAYAMDAMAGGLPRPDFTCLAVTPDFGLNGGEIYAGAGGGRVLRYGPSGWVLVTNAAGNGIIRRLAIPSDMTPANPRFFGILRSAPFVVEIVDGPGGATVTNLDAGLPDDRPMGLDTHPDFANQPILYLATGFSGIWTMDLSAPSPQWSPLGSGFPPYYCSDVEVSPDFASDGLIFAGTDYGMYQADITGAAQWTSVTTTIIADEADERFTTYAPQDPQNSYPDHPYPWYERWDGGAQGGVGMLANRVLLAKFDQSYLTTMVAGSHVDVLTFAGSNMGTVTVTATDPSTGVVLSTVTEDLDTGVWPPLIHSVGLPVPPFSGEFELRIDVSLTSGEVFAIDGLEIDF